MSLSRRSIHLAVLALSLTAANAVAQVTYPNASGGTAADPVLLLRQFRLLLGRRAEGQLFLRRARIEARANINEYIRRFIQPSFEGGRTTTTTTAANR